MNKSYSHRALQIATVVLFFKVIIIALFGYYFSKNAEHRAFEGLQVLFINLTHLVSVLGLVAIVFGIVGIVKKQLGWKLYLALPIAIIATLIYPMVFVA